MELVFQQSSSSIQRYLLTSYQSLVLHVAWTTGSQLLGHQPAGGAAEVAAELPQVHCTLGPALAAPDGAGANLCSPGKAHVAVVRPSV